MDLKEIKTGDIVATKSPHACGDNKWEIKRVGADVKLCCLKCGRTVLLSSEKAKKVIKRVEKSDR